MWVRFPPGTLLYKFCELRRAFGRSTENQSCFCAQQLVYLVELLMKKHLLVALTVVALATTALADIQDPPGNDYGPTRKLGRGISNFVIAPTEFFVTVNQINQTEGNSAGAGYGVWKGAGRAAARHVAGLIEILTFPFPIWHNG